MTVAIAGRTAVVTGAASGIGAALARHAARQGMAVAACDRDAPGLARLAADLDAAGIAHCLRVVDVTKADELASFAAECAELLPPIALLFVNAGVLRGGGVLHMPAADWRLLFDINVLGAIGTLQAFVPAMVAHGHGGQVVVTGSTGSMVVTPGLAAYCATKHALWPVTEALDAELQGTGVGVSLLMPGAVATPIFDAVDPDRAPPADSITPEAAAVIAFDGARARRAKILTHPGYVDRAVRRFETSLADLRGE
ncbi:SDR family oxidoreductase [Novosphingobium sp. MD-1]|uniref:SDR family NAD(P)-dependent oxidoreductase n=1 Tax=Novosphingobium sp. MD-1 TaxID=1630648 RepID=UPI000F7D9C11|nr:SDR family oxidoreductase [Novosphingobium sp. MD-1]